MNLLSDLKFMYQNMCSSLNSSTITLTETASLHLLNISFSLQVLQSTSTAKNCSIPDSFDLTIQYNYVNNDFIQNHHKNP